MNSYESSADLSWDTDSVMNVTGYQDFDLWKVQKGVPEYTSAISRTHTDIFSDKPECENGLNQQDHLCYLCGMTGHAMKQCTANKLQIKRNRTKNAVRLKGILEMKSASKKRTTIDTEAHGCVTSITSNRKLKRGERLRKYVEKKLGTVSSKFTNQSGISTTFTGKKRRKSHVKFERDTKRHNKLQKSNITSDFEERTPHSTNGCIIGMHIPNGCFYSAKNDISITNEMCASNSGTEDISTKSMRFVKRVHTGVHQWPIDPDFGTTNLQINAEDEDTIVQLKEEISVLFTELEEMIKSI